MHAGGTVQNQGLSPGQGREGPDGRQPRLRLRVRPHRRRDDGGGGGSAPLGSPSVSAPSTARQTAFPRLGTACQSPAHRLPVGRRTADTTAVEFKGIRFAGSVGWAGAPASSAESVTFSGVRNVWALTGCSGQSVAVYDAWRRVFVLFGSDGESSGDPAGWPQIRLDSRAARREPRALPGAPTPLIHGSVTAIPARSATVPASSWKSR